MVQKGIVIKPILKRFDPHLEPLLGNSLLSIIVFTAKRAGNGKIADFVFSFVNSKAARFLGRDDLTELLLGKELPELSLSIFPKLSIVTESGNKLIDKVSFSRGGKNFLLDAEICRVDDGCIFMFSDISGNASDHRSDEFLKALMDNNPSLVFMKDSEGRYIYLNRSYEEQYVHSSDWYGKTDFDLWPPESARLFRKNDDEVARSGKTMQFIEDSFDREGRRACWLNYKFPYTDPAGKKYVGGIGINVLNRILAEEALQFSEQKFRTIFEDSPVSMALLNRAGKFIDLNRAALVLYGGNSKKEIIGKSYFSFVYSPSVKEVRKMWKQAFGTGCLRGVELMLERKDGTCFEMLLNSTVLKDPSGDELLLVMGEDISTRKKHEKELFLSRERFRSILENSEDIIYCINLQTRKYEFISSSCEKILGYSPAEMSAMIVSHDSWFIHPEDRESLIATMQNSERTGSAVAEYRQLTKSGEYRWLENHVSVSYDSAGKPLYRYGNARDVTSQKNIRQELLMNQKLLKELVSNARTIICRIDSEDRIVYMNEYALDLFGYTEGEIIGQKIQKLIPDVDSQGRDLQNLLHEMKKNPEKFQVNVNENIKKSGERIWIEWHNKTLTSETGELTGNLAIGVDITENIRSNDALRESERRYREMAEKLDLALENGKIGTWDWDIATDTVLIDERNCRMLGLEPGTSVINLETFESVVHEHDLPQAKESIRAAVESGSTYESVFRTRAGNYLSSRALVRKDEAGKVLGMTGVVFDITGMKMDTEQHLFRLNEELARSNADLQQFAYVASHDLQEPLRMISSFTQLLEKQYGDKLDEKAREYISFSVDGAKRMYELLNGLLAYSRVQSKKSEFGPVDMNSVLSKVKANLRLAVEECSAVIESEDLPVVRADEPQMIQLMQNLIGNAIKFRRTTPIIRISASLDNIYHTFTVSDNGIGMESQYSERIFRIFQRLHAADYKGTGIGLAISRRIIDRHGGRIWVESVPGKGSDFYFTLPVVQLHDA